MVELVSTGSFAQFIREQVILLFWISLSSLVILLNKAILSGAAAFPFPIALTLWHQVRCLPNVLFVSSLAPHFAISSVFPLWLNLSGLTFLHGNTNALSHVRAILSQLCCFLTGAVIVHFRLLGMKPNDAITLEVFTQYIAPIGILYAVTLATGNGAYLYRSVSFIQMLKASMPAMVYFCSVLSKLERFSWSRFFNMLMISIGVAIASYGEMSFDMVRS